MMENEKYDLQRALNQYTGQFWYLRAIAFIYGQINLN